MRIRSTKPEFWRSRTVASVSWDARLVLKGLESYVDDNGVGKDDVALIVGDIFPRDMFANPRETVARVSEAISHLHRAGLLWRYEVDGLRLLYVSNWESIQRVDKAQNGRLPRPDGTMDYKSSIIRESVANVPEVLAPGTEEQGNRGTGESLPPALRTEPHQRASANTRETRAEVRMRELNATARSAEADRFATSFNQWAGGGIPSQTLIEIAQEVDTLLGDRIDPVQIANGIKAWHASDRIYPSQIPSFVAKAARPADTPKPTKATLRAVSTLDDAEALIAQFQEGTA